jgi:two-component system CheB/CheR fusion protein
VFATDIDSRAIASARLGVFAASIAADISAERLARFFTLEPGGQSYRIHRSIRDLLVFSEHNLIKDPPFSKIDLLSCRNLLIYLEADLQSQLMPMFHYALRPAGVLFLGSAEGVGECDALFSVLERRAKLYQRKDDVPGTPRASLNRLVAPLPATQLAAPPRSVRKSAAPGPLPMRGLMEQALLRQLALPSALVKADGDIVCLHGRVGKFLQPSTAESGMQNILTIAQVGLRAALATALQQAVASNTAGFAPYTGVAG